MRSSRHWRSLLPVTIAVLWMVVGAAEARKKAPGLQFESDLDRALAASAESGKPVAAVFVAAWCPLCGRMKREVFREPTVVAHEDDFIWVMIDIDRQLTVAQENGVQGVPLTRLIDPVDDRVLDLIGFQEPTNFASVLDRFLAPSEPAGVSDEAEPERGQASELTWRPKGYRGKGICFSHVGYGPLAINSQAPFQALRLGIRPRTPSTLGRGQFSARTSATWVNIWALDENDDTYFLDFEMFQFVAAVAYGITDHVEIEGEFQDRSRFGGAMDSFIQNFHDLFGIDQGGRDDVPKNQFNFELAPDGGPAVSLDSGDRGSFSRTAQLSLQHNVTCGTSRLPAISWSATARLETLDVDTEGGGSGLDLGLSVAVSRRFGKFYVYGTLGHAWFGRDDFRGMELEDTKVTLLLAGEWRFRPRQSLILQYLLTEGLVADFGPFSDSTNELTIGWKWEVRNGGILELGLIENIIEFDNGPDFGVHAGFSQRF